MKKLILSVLGALAMGFALILSAGTTLACCVVGTPPVITAIIADPDILWPPNHKFVEIALDVQGTDIEDWYVSSVDPQNLGPGEGDPLNDPDFGFDRQFLQLRAERSGKAGGRAYVVTVTATNSYGSDSAWVTVTVPHDMSGG